MIRIEGAHRIPPGIVTDWVHVGRRKSDESDFVVCWQLRIRLDSRLVSSSRINRRQTQHGAMHGHSDEHVAVSKHWLRPDALAQSARSRHSRRGYATSRQVSSLAKTNKKAHPLVGLCETLRRSTPTDCVLRCESCRRHVQ